MSMTTEQARLWFDENETNLLKFESILLDTMDRKMQLGVVYKNIDSHGRLSLQSYQDTGELVFAEIQLNVMIRDRKALLARILILAHEVGHFIDLTNSFDSNVNDYNETETTILEQDAWSFAYALLDALGFDEFGQAGWIAFRNMVAQTLSTYYVNEHTSRNESIKKASSFVNHLVAEKFVAPGEMSLV